MFSAIIYTRSPLQNVFEKKYCSSATVCTLCCIPPSLASKNREQKYTMRSCGFFNPSSVNSAELISVIEGTELVTLARTAVEKYLLESVIIRSEKEMQENAGIFVTLNYVTTSKKEYLRGCIGFPLPEKPLQQGVIEAAIAAATEDPRFPPLD